MDLLSFFGSCLSTAREWAERDTTHRLASLLEAYPDPQPGVLEPGLDVNGMAIACSDQLELAVSSKVAAFRQLVNSYVQDTGGVSVLLQMDEPWFNKDLFQLLCELCLMTDLSSCQRDFVAVAVCAVQTFGLDAIALLGMLVCVRSKYRLGPRAQAGADDETSWLAYAISRSINVSQEYLLSDACGSLPVSDLVNAVFV